MDWLLAEGNWFCRRFGHWWMPRSYYRDPADDRLGRRVCRLCGYFEGEH